MLCGRSWHVSVEGVLNRSLLKSRPAALVFCQLCHFTDVECIFKIRNKYYGLHSGVLH